MSGDVDFQRDFYDAHYRARAALLARQVAHPMFAAFYDRLAGRLLDRGPVTGPIRVCEFACGEGLLAAAFTRVAQARGRVLHYTGTDLSPGALEQVATVADGRLLAGDAAEVAQQLGEERFDVVCAKNLLHHLADPAPFLAAAAGLVAPAGRLIAAEMSRGSAQGWAVSILAPRRERYFFVAGVGRNIRAFKRAGLQLHAVTPFSFLPFELAFALRFDTPRTVANKLPEAVQDRIADLDDRLAARLPALATYLFWESGSANSTQ